MKYLLIAFFSCILSQVSAQATFTVEVSSDTVAVGELVEIKYTIENGEGRMEAPDMDQLPIVSGPNSSSSFMIQNGKKSSAMSYSYILKPMKEEVIEIPGASYIENGETMTIDPIQIVVMGDTSAPPVKQSYKAQPTPTRNREKRKF
ncbi:MAG: BatD family protein [Bacteroidota bacterium]|nr:BatD family protein [Bacteroidota bacterium]